MPLASIDPLLIVLLIFLILLLACLSTISFRSWLTPIISHLQTKLNAQEKNEPKGFHKLDAQAQEIKRNTAAR